MRWEALGLGGFGNMTTPAVSPQLAGGGTPHLLINCDMGGAYLSRNLGKTWQLFHYRELQGNVGLRPAFSPAYGQSDENRLIVAGSAFGELKVSEDGGKTWKKTNTGYGLIDEWRHHGEIALHPDDPNWILIGTSANCSFSGYRLIDESRCTNIPLCTDPGSILLSADQGATWKRVAHWDPTSFDRRESSSFFHEALGFPLALYVDRRSSSNGDVIYAATQRAVLVSRDCGEKWDILPLKGLPPDVTFVKNEEGKEEAREEDPVLRSFSGGALPDGSLHLYCTIRSSDKDGQIVGGVYLSKDEGDWERLAVEPNEVPPACSCVKDGASECRLLQFHQILTCHDDPALVYVLAANTGYDEADLDAGVHSSVYCSSNAGATWERIFFPYPKLAPDLYNVTPNWASVQLVRTKDRPGQPEPFWKPYVTEEPGNDAAMSPNEPGVVVRVGTRCHVRQPANGGRWLSADSALADPGTVDEANSETGWQCNGLVVTGAWHYYVDRHKKDRHFIAYTDCNYARSLDGGKSWIWGKFELAGEAEAWQNTVYEMAFDPENPGRMWAAFSSLHDIPTSNVVLHYQPPLPGKDKIGRIGFSKNFGESWQYEGVNSGIDKSESGEAKRIGPVTSIVYAARERALYAAVYEDGIYRAKDTGAAELKWTCISKNLGNLPNRRFFRVMVHDDGTVFALITARTEKGASGGVCFGECNDGVGLYRLSPRVGYWQLLGEVTASRLDWPRDFAVDPHDSGRIFLAVSEPRTSAESYLDSPGPCGNWCVPPKQSGVYTWDLATDTWSRLPLMGMPCSYRHAGVTIHPSRPHWLYMTLCGEIGMVIRRHPGLWLSRDYGRTCERFEQFPFKHVNRVSFDPDDPDVIYVCTNGAGVWRGPADPRDEMPYELVEGGAHG